MTKCDAKTFVLSKVAYFFTTLLQLENTPFMNHLILKCNLKIFC